MRRLALIALVVLGLGGAGLAAWQARGPQQAGTPFFFIQLSDPQFGMYTNDKDFGQETANFEFAVANVNRLKPSFVVITGDLVNKAGDAAQIAEYKRIRAKIDPSIPVHDMPGNHDVENSPTPATVAAYRTNIGRDRYVFQHGPLTGIVLNSTLIHTPAGAQGEADAQQTWLADELKKAKASGARHVVVIQHHPWYLKAADEPDQYFNIPTVRRAPLLALFREAGVKTLISGHYHQNAVVPGEPIEAITTGPVGMAQGQERSGMRMFIVTDAAIVHRYFEFGRLPNTVDASRGTFDPPARGGGGAGRAAAPPQK